MKTNKTVVIVSIILVLVGGGIFSSHHAIGADINVLGWVGLIYSLIAWIVSKNRKPKKQ